MASLWDSLILFVFRPILAVSFVVSLIILGWTAAWKLVLVHVPLVQEICGLRKKPPQPKPVTRRFLRYYDNIRSSNSGNNSLQGEEKS